MSTSDMRVLVLSSVYPSEGWCNPLMKALASGLPIVTTGVGGNAEVVRHDVDCFWSETEFASAVLRALDRPWDREAIVARASTMGWGRTAGQTMKEFRLALAPGHAVPAHAASG